MQFQKFKLLPLILFLLFLAGCSSSGGNGDITGVTLGGSAVKGIIQKGVVVAEELDSAGNVLRQVGSAMTGTDGSYSLTVDNTYKGGPIQITISADAMTEMKCDIPAGCGTRTDDITDPNSNTIVDFGEWYKPGTDNLTMTALVAEAASGDKLNANITPFTDMAARRAKAGGTLNKTAVYNANSEVSNLLGGVDILNTKPLDITDSSAVNSGSATAIAYAAFTASVGSLADTSSNANGTPDINGALSILGTTFSSGTIAASGSTSSSFSLQQIVSGAQTVMTHAGVVDTSGTLSAVQQEVTDAETTGTVDPTPSSTAGNATLSKVKAFVADVRTWGTVIDAETKDKANAFGKQVDMASMAANSSGQMLTSPALDNIFQIIGGYIDGTYTSTNLSSYNLGFTGGTISRSGSTYTVTNAVYSDGNGHTATINMTGEVPQDGSSTKSFTLGITSGTLRSDATDADITSGTVNLTTASNYTIDWTAIGNNTATPPSDITGGSVNLDLSLTQKQDQKGNALAASVTFNGKLAVTLTKPAKNSKGEYAWITPKTLTLSGGVSSSDGNSFDVTFNANATNADSFVPLGELAVGTVKSDIVTWQYLAMNGSTVNTFKLTTPDDTRTYMYNPTANMIDVNIAYTYGHKSQYQTSTNGATNITDYITRYFFAYNISSSYSVGEDGEYSVDTSNVDFSKDGSLSGTLKTPNFRIEDTSNFLNATASFTFNLQLSGLPKATVTISGDRTAYEAGKATVNISYDTRKIVLNGDIANSNLTGSINVTNQDGVTMTLSNLDANAGTGDITYNGTKYATISDTSEGLTKISYIDGTFEIL